MIGWIVKRYAARYGYRYVPPRDWGRAYIELSKPSDLSPLGHKLRARAFIGRGLACQAHDLIDRFEKFDA